jgi:SpoVK/Ycf46/Vps4 family AAA+-type ATPase
MASGKTLRQLIRAGARGDVNAFKEASEFIIREERDKQHHLLANDLERILHGDRVNIRPVGGTLATQIPCDAERGLPLLTVREPVRRLDEVVLSSDCRQILDRVLEEHHRHDVLRSYGLRPADRLLFRGPPGCGKTVTAEALATELDRPIVLVRLDSVVSSYLGATAANLRKVFDFVSDFPSVALFDEFDALGKERADPSEHGELRRVVNAVLQMFDAYDGKSTIIAATNHEGMLDSAVWRRFEEVLSFPLPDRTNVISLLSIKLRGVRRDFESDDRQMLTLFEGMTHADIERVLKRAIKAMVLRNEEFLQIRHLIQAAAAESQRVTAKRIKGVTRYAGVRSPKNPKRRTDK